jgi:Na+-translocating ferredoxin:NAD+ oxidoreductase RNF subunit RnfB
MTKISRMLPGHNCDECGHRQCKDYAEEMSIKGDFGKCPHLELERLVDTRAEIKEFLSTHNIEDRVEDLPPACQGCGEGIAGLKGDRKAIFSLGPIPGEPCREDLYPSPGLRTMSMETF